MNMIAINDQRLEAEPEVKRPVRNEAIETEAMSEWELARLTSETWSMEQD